MNDQRRSIKRLKEARFTVQPYLYMNEAFDVAIEALSQPERPKGRWIETGYYDNHYNPIYECSVCRENVADYRIHAHKFCLHCGADMRDGEEE